jgi:alpha-tubulin suppressor-like RCC1 family protein
VSAVALAAAIAALSLLSCDGRQEPSAPVTGPRLLSVTPDRAVPGQAVVLGGSGFGEDPARVSITFGDVRAEPLSVSETSIEVVVPDGVPSGEVAVQVSIAGLPTPATATLLVLPSGPRFSAIGAGGGFTCGIVRDEGAFCWGSGIGGLLGVGAELNHSPVPLRVSGGAAFRAIGVGRLHACALDPGGAAFCWGRNGSGQLGDGTMTPRPAPVPVAGGMAFTAISAGGFHTCGLVAGGEAWCWGENALGQLGVADTGVSAVPLPVAGGLRFSSISAGGFHTCGLTADGQAWCWGTNGHGELGTGTRENSSVPVRVASGLAFSSLSAGRSHSASRLAGGHTCALAADGQAWCWGFNLDGQLGDGTQQESPLPVPVDTETRFRTISAGAFHTCGVTLEDVPLCWGANDAGQLGGGLVNRSVTRPIAVLGRLRLELVSAGPASKSAIEAVRSHTCGLTSGGQAFCWGRNDSGQLGGGQVSTQSVPVPVVSP